VSAKRRRQAGGPGNPARNRTSSGPARPTERPATGQPMDSRARIGLLIVAMLLAALVVIGVDFLFSAIAGDGSPNDTGTPGAPVASASQLGVVVQGNGGHWTNVTPDQLSGMLAHKDFTLLNVKTPYSKEIDGTDLYIPYDQLTARASELPADKGARILVYCLSGGQSRVAAQTLLDLGYTNVWNLDGGMNAWVASGRNLVDKGRT
jgi:phage shock protein E